MQNIQWFPGHMTRAVRMMEEQVKLCDGIVMVLDARVPFACLNPKLDGVFGNRPVIYALNKVDLADNEKLKGVLAEFKSQNKNAIAVIGTQEKSRKALYDEIKKALQPVIEKYKLKGIKRPLRIMVAGIPNTGKSTLINLLSGGKKAKTGDKAGVTKDKQWIKFQDLELLDTPGTTEPSFKNQTYAKYLAYIGSINDDILDFCELSIELLGDLIENYPNSIKNAYGVDESLSGYELFSEIAIKRGAIKKGGDIDDERVGAMIINDFRKGKIGKILFR